MSAASHMYTKNCSFRMQDITGASFSMTDDGNSVSLEYGADLIEATTFGDDNRTHIPGIKDYTVNYSGYYTYATRNTVRVASALHELVGASQGTWFQYNPAGSAPTGGSDAWAGCVHIESLTIESPVAAITTVSFSLRPRSGSLSACADSLW